MTAKILAFRRAPVVREEAGLLSGLASCPRCRQLWGNVPGLRCPPYPECDCRTVGFDLDDLGPYLAETDNGF